jgi:hypothetical protein
VASQASGLFFVLKQRSTAAVFIARQILLTRDGNGHSQDIVLTTIRAPHDNLFHTSNLEVLAYSHGFEHAGHCAEGDRCGESAFRARI